MIYGTHGLIKLCDDLLQDKKEALDSLREMQPPRRFEKYIEQVNGENVEKTREILDDREIARRDDGQRVQGLYDEAIACLRRLQAIMANRGF